MENFTQTDPEAFAFLARVSARLDGLDGFHPDTPFADYLDAATRRGLFASTECRAFDADLSALIDRLGEEAFYAQVNAYAEEHLPGTFAAEHGKRERLAMEASK